MDEWVFTWWFGAIIVLGGGILAIEAFKLRNIFTAATVGFVILLIARVLFWGWPAMVPEYIDAIPYLLGYIVLQALFASK